MYAIVDFVTKALVQTNDFVFTGEANPWEVQMDLEQVKLGGFTNGEMHPQNYSHAVKVPYFMAQVIDDSWTNNPTDAQEIFDNIRSDDKELFWIENTTRRFDGYNYFGQHPEKMIAFFDKYMK